MKDSVVIDVLAGAGYGRNTCLYCEDCIKVGEDFALLHQADGSVGYAHVCCLIGYAAFEIDNTLMCFGVIGDPNPRVTETKRQAFKAAFKNTFSTWQCSHAAGAGWKSWPWGTA